MKTKILTFPILVASMASIMPLAAQLEKADADADAHTSSGSSSSSSSETMTRKIKIVNGKKVLDETEHTKNGRRVDSDQDDPAAENTPWLGLRATEVSSALRDQLGLGEDEGIVVKEIVENGPAEKADLRVNDILLKFDKLALSTPEDLRDALENSQIGQQVTIEYLRRGQKATKTITLEKRPKGAGNGFDDNGNFDEMKKRMRELMKNPGVNGANIQIDGFDDILDNPALPEEQKEMLRQVIGLMGNLGDGKNFNNSVNIEINGESHQDLNDILNDPTIPDSFKKVIRDMQERMDKFKVEHNVD